MHPLSYSLSPILQNVSILSFLVFFLLFRPFFSTYHIPIPPFCQRASAIANNNNNNPTYAWWDRIRCGCDIPLHLVRFLLAFLLASSSSACDTFNKQQGKTQQKKGVGGWGVQERDVGK
ncbi:hypothetical protein K457DRAFT_876258 [Linnemannia elongata AG-77]|uniref:Uncharacterized protein n=1 Tax=Linnemannia elongata AG-77 TaxID=1314771 RepID=A0A197JHR8_9FUNG|nr:hypothetical protein K457DRAFT_876258 [Linnemannia elongata AG-77]